MNKFVSFDPADYGISGLSNLGNTCFMNSGLQCIFQTWVLSQYYLTGDFIEDVRQYEGKEPLDLTFVREYVRTLTAYYEDNCVVKPMSVKSVIGRIHDCYAGNRQNDAHEFVIRLLDVLHRAGNGRPYTPLLVDGNRMKISDEMINANKVWNNYFGLLKNGGYSKVVEVFYGQHHSTLTCNLCGYVSHTFDPFASWSLSIEPGMKTLQNAIDGFSREEILDEKNKWRCEKCKMDSCAVRKIDVWKLPQCLIIHLKRFDAVGRKNDTNIVYPIEGLMVRGESDNVNRTYDLYAVNIHRGQMNYGHYLAHCRNANGKWYNYDDCSVEEVVSPQTQFAYILFYKQRI